MTRLTRTFPAFRRSMQMSTVQIFVFVEGQDSDPYFYDKLCASTLRSANVEYRVVAADRIASSGGKMALLLFYDHLRTVNSLADLFKGKRTFCLFYLDKDLDDVFHRKIFSDHIIYTRYYHVENYLFVEGDVLEAACSAASLDRESLAVTLGDIAVWRFNKAMLWKDWVVLCLFAEVFGIASRCNYRRSDSAVNKPSDAATDVALRSECEQELRARYGGTNSQFDRDFARIQRLVNRYYRLGKQDLIFKGKWYLDLLQRDIENAMPRRGFSSHALKNAILASLRTTINFQGAWTDHLRAPIQGLISQA